MEIWVVSYNKQWNPMKNGIFSISTGGIRISSDSTVLLTTWSIWDGQNLQISGGFWITDIPTFFVSSRCITAIFLRSRNSWEPFFWPRDSIGEKLLKRSCVQYCWDNECNMTYIYIFRHNKHTYMLFVYIIEFLALPVKKEFIDSHTPFKQKWNPKAPPKEESCLTI